VLVTILVLLVLIALLELLTLVATMRLHQRQSPSLPRSATSDPSDTKPRVIHMTDEREADLAEKMRRIA
jgi:hypothetical protein